jgi:hypothetical protein
MIMIISSITSASGHPSVIASLLCVRAQYSRCKPDHNGQAGRPGTANQKATTRLVAHGGFVRGRAARRFAPPAGHPEGTGARNPGQASRAARRPCANRPHWVSPTPDKVGLRVLHLSRAAGGHAPHAPPCPLRSAPGFLGPGSRRAFLRVGLAPPAPPAWGGPGALWARPAPDPTPQDSSVAGVTKVLHASSRPHPVASATPLV